MRKYQLLFTVIALLAAALLLIWSPGIKEDSAGTNTAGTGFKEYRLGTYPVTVKLPQTTQVASETPGGDEMLYSAFLKDKDLAFQGYLQLWKIADLEQFLANSREHSRFDFKDFQQEKIRLKTCQGYRIDWKAVMQDRSTVTGREYFLKKDDGSEVLRLSIFTGGDGFQKELVEVMDVLISSLEWK